MKKILLFIKLAFTLIITNAQIFTDGGINYNIISSSTVEVSSNSNFVGAANIPSVVTFEDVTYTVTSIGFAAFSDCYGLTSISIPSSVTTIEDNAFSSCRGLKSITIPNSVTSMGNNTFSSCTGLESINIPNTVTKIGYSSFQFCSNLTSITIPNSITKIDFNAFSYCTGLTSITIPGSVNSLGNGAFFGCTNLKSITVESASPLVINANVFGAMNLAEDTLIVPIGAISTYDAALVWTDFGNIQENDVTTAFNKTKQLEESVQVFPNPSNGMFSILNANGIVSIYNSVGEQVYEISINSTEENINLSHLANGLYFIHVDSKVIQVVKE